LCREGDEEEKEGDDGAGVIGDEVQRRPFTLPDAWDGVIVGYASGCVNGNGIRRHTCRRRTCGAWLCVEANSKTTADPPPAAKDDNQKTTAATIATATPDPPFNFAQGSSRMTLRKTTAAAERCRGDSIEG
jgi:hypothetical protein